MKKLTTEQYKELAGRLKIAREQLNKSLIIISHGLPHSSTEYSKIKRSLAITDELRSALDNRWYCENKDQWIDLYFSINPTETFEKIVFIEEGNHFKLDTAEVEKC